MLNVQHRHEFLVPQMSMEDTHTAGLIETHFNLKQKQRLCGGNIPSSGKPLWM